MIVRNESKVIERCLNSVLPIIDSWVIFDTGSTDGTQQIIKDFMKKKGIPGELHESPWANFEKNRNEALVAAKGKADYIFFIDADEYLVYDAEFKLPDLDKDSYLITIQHPGGMKYGKLMLINNHKDWKWVGVLHEGVYPIPSTAERSIGTIEKVVNIYTIEGCRSQDSKKYEKDAAVLEAALKDEPNNTRYVFYLAQSYRDGGENEKAMLNYEKRAKMGGWDEEVFVALLEAAILKEIQARPRDEIVNGYIKAFQSRPTRVEPLYYLANYYRNNKEYELGYRTAKIGSSVPLPKDILFVANWIYDYGMLLEQSVNAYWVGNYEESQKISLDLLKKSTLPEDMRALVQGNLGHANNKLLEKELVAK